MDIIFNYGGGWQSVAMSLLIIEGKLDRPDLIVFADTGYEKETTLRYYRDHVEPLFKKNSLKLEIAPHELATVDLYAKNGQFLVPAYTSGGLLKKFCSKEWKTRVISRYLKTKGYGRKNPLINWIGYASDEFSRMKDHETGWINNGYPLIYEFPLKKIECRDYVLSSGLPMPYHSSCYFCPFQHDDEWSLLAKNDLKKAISIETEARNKDRLNDLYFHRARKPLSEVNFSKSNNEPDLFSCSEGGCFT